MKWKKLSTIFLFITVTVFIAMGVLMISYSGANFERTNLFFGSVLIGTAIPPLMLYTSMRYYKEGRRIPFFILGGASIAVGIVFICNQSIDISHMIITWGIYSIVLASFTICDSLVELKTNKLELIEIVLCLADIVFSILLIVRTDAAVNLHLAFVGITFIIKGIIYIIEYFLVFRHI